LPASCDDASQARCFLRPLSARAVRAGHKKKPRFAAFFLRGSPATPFATTTSAWCATSNVVEVGFDDEPEAFSNINTREELHTWENAPPA
jgi:hypothetical protein